METGLKDQVIVITGASGGIGAASARAFAAEGARLVLAAYRNIATVNDLAEELEVECLPFHADLTREAEVDRLFESAIERFGRIDALIANAGAWVAQPQPLHRMSLEHWNRVVAINQTSVFLCARAYFRYLEKEKPTRASLLIVSSASAVFGAEGHAEYAAAKAATAFGLTRSLKNEIVRLVPMGRVNAICPGWVYTPMAEPALKHSENVRRALQTRPIKRIGRSEEMADLIVFLTSDRLSGHVTGEVITIAGGMEGRVLHPPESIDVTEA